MENITSNEGIPDLNEELNTIQIERTSSNDGHEELLRKRGIITKLMKNCELSAKEGDRVYIIPKDWFDKFFSEELKSENDLGPIDVASIIKDYEHFVLEDYNSVPYTSVPEPLFLQFQEWYGITDLSQPVVTYLIENENGELVTEYNKRIFRLHHLTIGESSRNNYTLNQSYIVLSSLNLYSDLKVKAIQQFAKNQNYLNMENHEFRVWVVEDNETNSANTALSSYEITPLQFLSLSSKELIAEDMFHKLLKSTSSQPCDIIIETRNLNDGKWPSYFFMYNNPMTMTGIVGLSNLGNTCYMNSGLQCLVHIPKLRDYFFYGGYEQEINLDNPLGYNGTVATAFGNLIQNLYSYHWNQQQYQSYSPNRFKMTLGQANSMFAGYMQQDSQEFLAFLLDSLHEDLNRIHDKPYIEKPTLETSEELADENAVKQLAKKTWDAHLARNDSVINDLFVGMYKSTLKCPTCKNISITFDPYNDLTLPLPISTVWNKKVKIFPQKSPPCILEVELPKSATYNDLKDYVATYSNIDSSSLFGCEIFNHQFYRNFESPISDSNYLPVQELISETDDIIFYEIIINPGDIILPVINTRIEEGFNSPSLFGVPFFVTVSDEERRNPFLIYQKLEKLYTNLSGGYIQLRETLNNENQLNAIFPNLVAKYGKEDMEPINDIIDTLYDPNDSTDGIFTLKTISESRDEIEIESPSKTQPWIPESNINYKLADDIFNFSSVILRDIYYYNKMENQTSDAENASSTDNSNSEDNMEISTDSPVVDGSDLGNSESNHKPEKYQSELDKLCIESSSILVCEWTQKSIDEVFTDDKPIDWEHPALLENKELLLAQKQRNSASPNIITLDSCLKLFSKPEVLGINDSWYCPKCKEHRQATKQLELWNTPEILLIHLKRFENQRSFSDKIDAVVDFPIEGLDMTPYVVDSVVEDGCIYDLFAVDNHYGGLGGGHYTSYVKNNIDNRWYYFDDSRVSSTDPKKSVAGSAYLLFYCKREQNPNGIGNSKLQDIIINSRTKYEERWQEILNSQTQLYESTKDIVSQETSLNIGYTPDSKNKSYEIEPNNSPSLNNSHSDTTESETFELKQDKNGSESSEDDILSRKSTGYSTESLEVGNLDINEADENGGRRKLRLLKKVYGSDTNPEDEDEC